MTTRGWVTLEDAEVIRTTPLAVLVKCSGTETWIPRSVCMDGDNLAEHDTDICVQGWFAEKEGLE